MDKELTFSATITLDDSERTLCECWTRVMGYFRPMSHYNIGKKSEFKERKWFTEAKCNKKGE